jgi:hypothetical protein
MISDMVREQAARQFAPPVLTEVVAALDGTPLPLLETADRRRDHDRVQLAVLKIAGSDVATFHKALKDAARDWRDVLVWAGLAHGNWPEVLRAAGMPVPD